MIRQDDSRIKNEKVKKNNGLYLSLLFLLNQKCGLKLNPSKIDIYFTQIEAKYNEFSIENTLDFFKIEASVSQESLSYKPKKNDSILICYSKDDINQYVVGVGNVVCYNPLGNTLKGKPAEAIVIKFK